MIKTPADIESLRDADTTLLSLTVPEFTASLKSQKIRNLKSIQLLQRPFQNTN